MENLIVSKSPHVTSANSTRRIMLDVCIALIPAFVASIVFFGPRALLVFLVSVAAAFAAEFLYDLCLIRKWDRHWYRKLSVWDCSCLVTGLLVAFNVPAGIPLWMPVLGSIFAIVIVKMLFGGIGRNFANPALAARIFLFVSFGAYMVSTPVVDAFTNSTIYSSATWLGSGTTIADGAISVAPRSGYWAGSEWLAMFLGCHASAAMGETSILAILIGYVYLSVRKVIDFRYPLMTVGSAAVFALLFDALPNAAGANIWNVTIGHVLSGGLVFGSVFMATDYATSPSTFRGNVINSIGIGFFCILLRVFSAMPEGMSFAILLMNVLTPLIDKYCVPKPFGYTKPAKPAKRKKAPTGSEGEEAKA